MDTAPNSEGDCAACRCQGIRCGPDCVLAPYFPAERHADFEPVHRFFGPQNAADMIMAVSSDLRQAIADFLVIRALNSEILRSELELLFLNKQIQLYQAIATTPFQEAVHASKKNS